MILTTTALISIIGSSTMTGIGISYICMYFKNKREERFELYDEDDFSYDEMVGAITPFETIKK